MAIVKFDDFKKEEEKDNLQDFKRGFTKNSERQQFPRNVKSRFNDKTRKIDYLSIEEVDDKIEGLEKEIERRNPTPKEKLEMRSLDSYPYSVKLSDFWADKGDRYDTGADSDKPEEYVLTQKDVDDSYSESNIEDSFDSDYEEDNF
jgi:uncharacterized small protein (DUF1192 family)